jgi:pyruvate-ferredoxin/flavodoxin oxidoreductase
MLLKKSSPKTTSSYPFPGKQEILDGYSAIHTVESLAGEIVESDSLGLFAGGLSITGSRVAAMVNETHTLRISGMLKEAAYKRLPLVIHMMSSPVLASALGNEIYGANQAFEDSGFFQLFAKNVQEAVDFTLIAHRIAEMSLIPGICLLESQSSAFSLQTVLLPEAELIRKYLGNPGDKIESPTPAQKILFGERRRRIPEWIDIDRPVGIGGIYGTESRFRSETARKPFFYDHLIAFADFAMQEYGELTGRFYTRAAGFGMKNAEYTLIARGAIVNELEVLTQFLRRRRKIKIGVLDINMVRPFPGELLSHLLKGKKGVTVLEPSGATLSEDPPLLREIRSSIDRAMENGLSKNAAVPYPDHAVYEKISDRPAFYAGIYGSSQLSFDELLAVVENMQAQNNSAKKQFYIGVEFFHPRLRFPKLETLQQRIKKGYPELEKISLPGRSGTKQRLPRKHHAVQMQSLIGRELQETGAALAKIIAAAGYSQINTFSRQNAAAFNRPEIYSILFSKAGENPPQTLSQEVEVLIVANPEFLSDVSQLAENGALIVQTDLSPQMLWEGFSEGIRSQIRRRNIRLFAIDALEISRDITSIPGYVNQISLAVLTGTLLTHGGIFSEKNQEEIKGHYRQSLLDQWGEGHFLVDEISTALQRGGEEAKTVDWRELPEFTGLTPPEPEAPWTVREVKKVDGTLFDPARFWDSVGYFYETGNTGQTITDPFIASDVLPARSSAFRDMTPYRVFVPRLLPENCTACGLCWAHCPDSALPPVVQDLPAMIETALDRCKADGNAMIQLQRIAGQLAKQAYRIFSADDLHQYRYLNELLGEAYNRLIELMGAKGDQLDALNAEFELVKGIVKDFPIVKSHIFFKERHDLQKGSGAIFSININPMSCKNCLECINICPDNALEPVKQSEEVLETYRRGWQFARSLPELSEDQLGQFISEKRPKSSLNQLLRKKAYHSLPGGDVAFPGSGVKTAVHLLTASVEALMQPRINAFLAKIEELISRIEAKIQGRLESAVRINDFEEFAKKLSRVSDGNLNSKDLAHLLADDQLEDKLNREQLQQLNKLLGELKELQQLYREGAHGDGRARMTLILNGGSISLWGATYPYNPHPYPWVNKPGTDIAGFAEGIFAGTARKMAQAFKAVRLAELELEDAYSPADHDLFFEKFGWQDFSAAEKELCPPLLILSDTESLGNLPLEGISRILSGKLPVKVAVINTTTGLSREVAVSRGNTGDVDPEIGLFALSFQRSFVLQTNPGAPEHLIRGVMEGMAMDRPALFHIYASEPHQHGLLTYQAAKQEGLAILSRRSPLFKYNPQLEGAFGDRFSLEGNPQPQSEWATRDMEVKDSSGVGSTWSQQVTFADWAVNEGRFRSEFTRVPKSRWHDQMVALAEYITLNTKERAGREPFIDLFDSGGQAVRVVVSGRIVAATENSLERWQLLNEMTGLRVTAEERGEEWQNAFQEEVSKQKQAIEKEYAEKLAQLEQQHFQVYHQRLTQKLLAYFKSGQSVESLSKSLQEIVTNKDSKIKDSKIKD